jgi:phosphatidylserine decarboxylase
MHQYVDRQSGRVCTERLHADAMVRFLYGPIREQMPWMFRALLSARHTRLLGYLQYDAPWTSAAWRRFARDHDIDLRECLDDPGRFRTARDLFERRIRYWSVRPMPAGQAAVVSPADARALVGDCHDRTLLAVKEKFFTVPELLGTDSPWLSGFARGSFAIFRLTPDKYHYNHSPVSGVIVDHYRVSGAFHSCNPAAAITVATPFAKNERVVTLIDTDVPGGTGVGTVAMIEITALMIGEIVQCASICRYESPRPIGRGTVLVKGAPKSLFRPGSSTTVLLFEPGRIRFAEDLERNRTRADASSRYSLGFGYPLVETDVRVRSLLGHACPAASTGQENEP